MRLPPKPEIQGSSSLAINWLRALGCLWCAIALLYCMLHCCSACVALGVSASLIGSSSCLKIFNEISCFRFHISLEYRVQYGVVKPTTASLIYRQRQAVLLVSDQIQCMHALDHGLRNSYLHFQLWCSVLLLGWLWNGWTRAKGYAENI